MKRKCNSINIKFTFVFKGQKTSHSMPVLCFQRISRHDASCPLGLSKTKTQSRLAVLQQGQKEDRQTRAGGYLKTRQRFLLSCQTERATRNTSSSCSGHMPEGMGPLTRESSALAVGVMNIKNAFKNTDRTMFSWRIYNEKSLPSAYWSPACGAVQQFSNLFCFHAKQKGPRETRHSRAVGTCRKAWGH